MGGWSRDAKNTRVEIEDGEDPEFGEGAVSRAFGVIEAEDTDARVSNAPHHESPALQMEVESNDGIAPPPEHKQELTSTSISTEVALCTADPVDHLVPNPIVKGGLDMTAMVKSPVFYPLFLRSVYSLYIFFFRYVRMLKSPVPYGVWEMDSPLLRLWNKANH